MILIYPPKNKKLKMGRIQSYYVKPFFKGQSKLHFFLWKVKELHVNTKNASIHTGLFRCDISHSQNITIDSFTFFESWPRLANDIFSLKCLFFFFDNVSLKCLLVYYLLDSFKYQKGPKLFLDWECDTLFCCTSPQ